jgi:hypothetical protein
MTLKAHFDGKQIVLDEPLPPGLAPNTPITITIGNGQANDAEEFDALAEIARMAQPLGLPPDFAAQHEHYGKGLPKRWRAGSTPRTGAASASSAAESHVRLPGSWTRAREPVSGEDRGVAAGAGRIKVGGRVTLHRFRIMRDEVGQPDEH